MRVGARVPPAPPPTPPRRRRRNGPGAPVHFRLRAEPVHGHLRSQMIGRLGRGGCPAACADAAAAAAGAPATPARRCRRRPMWPGAATLRGQLLGRVPARRQGADGPTAGSGSTARGLLVVPCSKSTPGPRGGTRRAAAAGPPPGPPPALHSTRIMSPVAPLRRSGWPRLRASSARPEHRWHSGANHFPRSTACSARARAARPGHGRT